MACRRESRVSSAWLGGRKWLRRQEANTTRHVSRIPVSWWLELLHDTPRENKVSTLKQYLRSNPKTNYKGMLGGSLLEQQVDDVTMCGCVNDSTPRRRFGYKTHKSRNKPGVSLEGRHVHVPRYRYHRYRGEDIVRRYLYYNSVQLATELLMLASPWCDTTFKCAENTFLNTKCFFDEFVGRYLGPRLVHISPPPLFFLYIYIFFEFGTPRFAHKPYGRHP